MIRVENVNVDSAVIDINDVRRIEARKAFETEIPDAWHRELSFVDNEGRCITIRLYGRSKEDMEIMEVEY